MGSVDSLQLPDFTGKALSISTMDDDNSHDMVNPVFEMQAGRLFVVGSVHDGASDSNWASGASLPPCDHWGEAARIPRNA